MDFNIDFDPYEMLGVSKDATQQQIKAAYAKMAKKHHPDQHMEPEAKKKAEERFMKIAKSFEILNNPKSRKMYDTRGQYEGAQIDAEELAKHFQNNPLFANLFGGGAMGGSNRVGFSFNMGGNDSMGGGFEDIFSSAFGGGGGPSSGFRQRNSSHQRAAAAPVQKPKAPTQYQDIEVTLEQLFSGATISHCVNGNYFNVPIKAGLKPGSLITFENQGKYDPNSQSPGDLVFIVKAKPHGTFKLYDRDLLLELNVSLKDVFEKRNRVFEVIAIDNTRHTINIDANTIIKDGSRHIIQGKGLPATKAGTKSGDLIVIFRVKVPEISNEKRQKIVELL